MRVILCERCRTGTECDERDVCVCGSLVDHHGMYDGHSPVSTHYYYGTEYVVPDWRWFFRAMNICVLFSLVAAFVFDELGWFRCAWAAVSFEIGFILLAAGGWLNYQRESRR